MNPLKKLQQNPKLHNAFRQLGADWLVTDELQQEMESFTCIMYGQARMTSVDAVRAKMLRKMVGADKVLDSKSKVDLERLPPQYVVKYKNNKFPGSELYRKMCPFVSESCLHQKLCQITGCEKKNQPMRLRKRKNCSLAIFLLFLSRNMVNML